MRIACFVRCGIAVLVALALLVAGGSMSQASMLNLVPEGSVATDITAFFTSASYNSTTMVLSISGSPVTIAYDGTAPPDATISSGGVGMPASYQINVSVDNSGALLGPSTPTDLNIIGRIAGGPHPSPVYGPLLTGEVIAFGYADSSPTRLFEFLFQTTGGSQQAQFGPIVGVVFDSISGFSGTFATNFSTSVSGNADNFSVPEPTTAVLSILGLCGFLAVVCRRRRSVAATQHKEISPARFAP